ncbi:hypothetical protein BB559_002529 [Furculomyces boomerangus]|uniref:Uncharacterized protein n=1 Tax=Furculomyces boomerangus TaxID=61424 RepID=A0A2T9YUL2_9FUNG|nr:hypothetical protein BB559_002529 [Furculomyces boomerangus]
MLGVNDAALEFSPVHVPLEEFKQNMIEMILHVRDPSSKSYSPETKIVLITPLPVCEPMWEDNCLKRKTRMDRGESFTKKYVDATLEIGKALGVPVVNVFDGIKKEIKISKSKLLSEKSTTDTRWLGYNEFFLDGLHLNSKGNDILAKLLFESIDKNFPELQPKKMELFIPSAAEVIKFQHIQNLAQRNSLKSKL